MQTSLWPRRYTVSSQHEHFLLSYVWIPHHRFRLHGTSRGSNELLVHPYVRGVADAERLLEFVQAGAESQESYGEGVTEVHRRDAPHSYLVAALPDGVLQRLRGSNGPGGAGHDQLRRLVVARAEVAADGLYRLVGEAPYARGEVGAWTAEVSLGGFEVNVALAEGTDLAHRHPRVEHEPYDRVVAGVVAGIQGEGEELVHLIFFQEDYLLVERLVHRFDGVEVYVDVRGGTSPIEEPPYSGVLAVHSEALAVAFEEIVAKLHNGADAHVLDPANVPLFEEAGELVEVGHVELGRARACASVVPKMGCEGFDQVVYPHAHHSNGKSVLLGILPEGDKYSKSFGLAGLAGNLAVPPGLTNSAGERDGLGEAPHGPGRENRHTARGELPPARGSTESSPGYLRRRAHIGGHEDHGAEAWPEGRGRADRIEAGRARQGGHTPRARQRPALDSGLEHVHHRARPRLSADQGALRLLQTRQDETR